MRHQDTTEKIIGCFYDVYNELGPGYLESVYQNSLVIVFKDRNIANTREAPLVVTFRGQSVGEFRADFLVEGKIIVELKAMQALSPVHDAQLINYLKVTGLSVGLLLNFGAKAEVKRRVLGPMNPPLSV